MNKKRIDKLLPVALEVLKSDECGISKDGASILKGYRSALSTFGASVTMGSFKAAVAFFSKDAEKGKSAISRSKLLKAMYYVHSREWKESEIICKEVLAIKDASAIRQMQNGFLHASVALKLAMNTFELIDGSGKGRK